MNSVIDSGKVKGVSCHHVQRGTEGRSMAYFVKVIPPSGRARVHVGGCKFCREGQGMENQDKGTGPTYWQPAYPVSGFKTVSEAEAFMNGLGTRYQDKGLCSYCMRNNAST